MITFCSWFIILANSNDNEDIHWHSPNQSPLLENEVEKDEPELKKKNPVKLIGKLL